MKAEEMFRSRRTVVFLVLAALGIACRGGTGPALAHAEAAANVRPSSSVPISKSAGSSRPAIERPASGERRAPANTEGRKTEVAPAEKATADSDDTASCPAGMVLVEGEYCSKLDHACEKSWYDESNKKTVCERFAPRARCIGDKTKKRFCIDKYEWPNRKGERPEVMNKFHQAQVKCAALGKRLCTESEWTMACEGPKMLPFPYGYERDTEVCHGDVLWDSPNMPKVAERDRDELARLWKGVRSGSQPACVSDYGVYDMPGNADEVVASETFSSDFRGKFDSVHTGGPWYKGVRNQCRPKIYTHDEGFYYYFLSFRCCAEPDGKATDPRTPKQKKQKWGMDRVERIGGFTQEDVKRALSIKAKQGHCSCRPADVRCNTICGTLLGTSAKDFPKTSKVKRTPPPAAEQAAPSEGTSPGSASSADRAPSKAAQNPGKERP